MDMPNEVRDWAKGCDPFELVAAVRQGTHELNEQEGLANLPESDKQKIVAATEEVASRFEQASRSALGSQRVPAGDIVGG